MFNCGDKSTILLIKDTTIEDTKEFPVVKLMESM